MLFLTWCASTEPFAALTIKTCPSFVPGALSASGPGRSDFFTSPICCLPKDPTCQKFARRLSKSPGSSLRRKGLFGNLLVVFLIFASAMCKYAEKTKRADFEFFGLSPPFVGLAKHANDAITASTDNITIRHRRNRPYGNGRMHDDLCALSI